MRTVITTKSGSVYTIRHEVDQEGEPHYYLSANNVPNERFEKLSEYETEIYPPRIQTTDRDPAPLPPGTQWYEAVGYRLNFIEVFPAPGVFRAGRLFPHGEIVCSRVREIMTDEGV